MANNRQSLWSNLIQRRWFQVFIVAILSLGVFFIIRKIRQDKKKRGITGDNQKDLGVLCQVDGMCGDAGLNRVLELQEIAATMSKAFWNFRTHAWGTIVLWRVDEDEDLFIQEANRIATATEASLVSDYYREYNSRFDTSTLLTPQKGLSLKADAIKFLSNSELSRIPQFVQNTWR